MHSKIGEKVKCTYFGETKNGDKVDKFTLVGTGGLVAEIITYGATIQSLHFDGKDVVLGYDSLAEYENNGGYLGATIGRFGNRIRDGRFSLNGREFSLAKNEKGVSHLHGGNVGFDKVVYKSEVIQCEFPSVKMSYLSADGEEGFPGNFDFSITFSIGDDNELSIKYEGVCDSDTIVNLTNHSYFNLNGFDGGCVLDTEMQIFAKHITPTDETLIPNGELMPVAGNAFDFTKVKTIGKDIDSASDEQGSAGEQIKFGSGYDVNYVVGMNRQMRKASYCYSPSSKIAMECYTDLPGVQFYSCNSNVVDRGKGGIPVSKHQGFCLETQFFPNSPNVKNFPSCVLKKDENYFSETVYKFSVN